MISRPGSYIAVLTLTMAAAPVALAQSGGSDRNKPSAAGVKVGNTDRKGDIATGAKRSSRATAGEPVASSRDKVRRGGIIVLRDPVAFGVAASTPRPAAPSSSSAALAAQSGVTNAASGSVVIQPAGPSTQTAGIPGITQQGGVTAPSASAAAPAAAPQPGPATTQGSTPAQIQGAVGAQAGSEAQGAAAIQALPQPSATPPGPAAQPVVPSVPAGVILAPRNETPTGTSGALIGIPPLEQGR